MAFLSQASHLGSLLLPHNAFQEHAAHPAEWSAALHAKGSERTCIRSGLATFLHDAFTAHPHYVVECENNCCRNDMGTHLHADSLQMLRLSGRCVPDISSGWWTGPAHSGRRYSHRAE